MLRPYSEFSVVKAHLGANLSVRPQKYLTVPVRFQAQRNLMGILKMLSIAESRKPIHVSGKFD